MKSSDLFRNSEPPERRSGTHGQADVCDRSPARAGLLSGPSRAAPTTDAPDRFVEQLPA